MHEDLERIVAIDRLDRSSDQIRRTRNAARQRLNDARTALEAAKTALTEAEATLEANRVEERALSRRLSDARQAQQRALRVLETGVGDPEAAQRQHDRSGALIDELETGMLEVLETQDTLIEARDLATRTRDAQITAVAEAESALPPAESEAEAALAADAAARAPLYDGLPTELQQRYDDQRAKRRWAVARIREKACNACNTVVQQQHVADLKRGLIRPCMGCGRFIVPSDA